MNAKWVVFAVFRPPDICSKVLLLSFILGSPAMYLVIILTDVMRGRADASDVKKHIPCWICNGDTIPSIIHKFCVSPSQSIFEATRSALYSACRLCREKRETNTQPLLQQSDCHSCGHRALVFKIHVLCAGGTVATIS